MEKSFFLKDCLTEGDIALVGLIIERDGCPTASLPLLGYADFTAKQDGFEQFGPTLRKAVDDYMDDIEAALKRVVMGVE